MSRWGSSDKIPKPSFRRINSKVKEIKVGIMVITIERVIMTEMGITTAKTTLTGVTMVTEMIGMGPMFYLIIMKFLLGMVEIVRRELRICCRKYEEV